MTRVVYEFSPLSYRDLDESRDIAELLADFRFRVVRIWPDGRREVLLQFLVPQGFSTDWASVPWYFRWLLPRKRFGRRGPLVHDFLYGLNGFDRFLADAIFRAVMAVEQIPLYRRVPAFYAVRAFGWMHRSAG